MSWSKAADRHGRKPVLLLSLFGTFLASAGFGFSRRIWHMYFWRCVAGIFGGNAVVIRTLSAENSDKSNQAKAFSYFAFAANVGGLIGPALGGFLAEPAKNYPNVFGGIQLLHDYPFCLPCLVVTGYVVACMLLCAVCLKEPQQAVNPASGPVSDVLNRRTLRAL
ncbi:hypothetical protein JCM24511_02132, partial [Saitozyma sp. JCM 24511]